MEATFHSHPWIDSGQQKLFKWPEDPPHCRNPQSPQTPSSWWHLHPGETFFKGFSFQLSVFPQLFSLLFLESAFSQFHSVSRFYFLEEEKSVWYEGAVYLLLAKLASMLREGFSVCLCNWVVWQIYTFQIVFKKEKGSWWMHPKHQDVLVPPSHYQCVGLIVHNVKAKPNSSAEPGWV